MGARMAGQFILVLDEGTTSTRAMLFAPDGTLHGTAQPVPLAEVAARQDISARYLEQVAADLRKAGYVRSVKGAQGGYLLAMEPASIGLAPLITLLEGDIRLTDEAQAPTSRLEQCLNDALFEKLNHTVAGYLGGHTLQNLVDEYRHRLDAGMYYL